MVQAWPDPSFTWTLHLNELNDPNSNSLRSQNPERVQLFSMFFFCHGEMHQAVGYSCTSLTWSILEFCEFGETNWDSIGNTGYDWIILVWLDWCILDIIELIICIYIYKYYSGYVWKFWPICFFGGFETSRNIDFKAGVGRAAWRGYKHWCIPGWHPLLEASGRIFKLMIYYTCINEINWT